MAIFSIWPDIRPISVYSNRPYTGIRQVKSVSGRHGIPDIKKAGLSGRISGASLIKSSVVEPEPEPHKKISIFELCNTNAKG
jgi:hypothetical protein